LPVHLGIGVELGFARRKQQQASVAVAPEPRGAIDRAPSR
jgi:hypothetical protein